MFSSLANDDDGRWVGEVKSLYAYLFSIQLHLCSDRLRECCWVRFASAMPTFTADEPPGRNGWRDDGEGISAQGRIGWTRPSRSDLILLLAY